MGCRVWCIECRVSRVVIQDGKVSSFVFQEWETTPQGDIIRAPCARRRSPPERLSIIGATNFFLLLVPRYVFLLLVPRSSPERLSIIGHISRQFKGSTLRVEHLEVARVVLSVPAAQLPIVIPSPNVFLLLANIYLLLINDFLLYVFLLLLTSFYFWRAIPRGGTSRARCARGPAAHHRLPPERRSIIVVPHIGHLSRQFEDSVGRINFWRAIPRGGTSRARCAHGPAGHRRSSPTPLSPRTSTPPSRDTACDHSLVKITKINADQQVLFPGKTMEDQK